MLVGLSERAVDTKGRIILPKEYRRDFDDGVIVTKGLDSCLLLYPMEEWERVNARIAEMPTGDEATLRFTRLFFSNASNLLPDSQGRILIPPRLRSMAQVEKEVVIVGLANRAEVWSPENWERYVEENASQYEQSARDIRI